MEPVKSVSAVLTAISEITKSDESTSISRSPSKSPNYDVALRKLGFVLKDLNDDLAEEDSDNQEDTGIVLQQVLETKLIFRLTEFLIIPVVPELRVSLSCTFYLKKFVEICLFTKR
eukprot:m.11940 g.11940  ORF g.11940 m.11940 type:complete len:116 (-) comp4561_c0_seq1:1895-2242(-)